MRGERREKRGGNAKITLWPSMPSMKNKWPVKPKRLGTTDLNELNEIIIYSQNLCLQFRDDKFHRLNVQSY